MKILFVVQGEGRGHLTQAISLYQMLTSQGHTVEKVLIGKSSVRQIPEFVYQQLSCPVESFESPNFLPTAKNKQFNLWKSISWNMVRFPVFYKSIRFIRQNIKESETEVVVNFYELLTGLTYLLTRPKAEMVCVAHQYLFLHPDFVFPKTNRVALSLLKLFTRITAFGATRKLALSFRKMKEVTEENLVVVPPLLRKEVLDLKPEKGNHLLAYLLNSGFSEEVIEWHKENKETNIHLFWDKKDAPEELTVNPNLVFHRINNHKFLQYMATSKGYATTAGFESVCEAMYLGKPILMIPTHIEQECNAFDAQQVGAGVVSQSFNLDRLISISEKEQEHLPFRHWVKQANWLILREFRKDILTEKYTTSLFQRFIIRQVYKVGKRFSL